MTTTEVASDLNLTYETLWISKLVDFNAGKTQLVSFERFNNTSSIDVRTVAICNKRRVL